jgi:hypothetical protein
VADNPQTPKKSITPDWLVQGALTRIGDTFDLLTGRRWRPSSSLATSGLIERMKMLLDREIKVDDAGRSFVPHNIKLKMQWDKFSTDSETSLKKLEHELLTAAVDHISDNRYYTHAPLHLEVKPDYFTEGVKLFVSFDEFVGEEEREGELNVTVPAAKVSDLIPEGIVMPGQAPPPPVPGGELHLRFRIDGGDEVTRNFELQPGRRLSIGRTRENDIALDHTSVSKMHASLLLNSAGRLVVADTGSTNGTYLNGERIAYGKAIEIFAGDKVKFGAIDVELAYAPHEPEEETVSPDAPTQAYTAADLQFAKRTEILRPVGDEKEPKG